MNLSRRAALVLAGSAAPGLSTARADSTGLWHEAAAAGLWYGSASDTDIAAAPQSYSAAFTRHCSLLAPNMGWHRVAPSPGAAWPAWEDPNIGFARNHGMRLTGGHLLWHKALPSYFGAAEAGKPARDLAAAHIAMMVRHYRGQAWSWNVVNEAIDTQAGAPGALRPSVLALKLGSGFIADAFHAARAADPDCVLAYNDTQFEMATPYHEARRGALLRLLDGLLRAGAPIGAVGLQTHLRLDGARFDGGVYRRFLHAIASRGLRILITELDVFDIGVNGTVPERDAAVAGFYRTVLAAITEEPAVASVVTWGLSDRYTWLNPRTDPSYRRRDGEPARPLPLDDEFQPKPAFAAMEAAFRAAPSRVRA